MNGWDRKTTLPSGVFKKLLLKKKRKVESKKKSSMFMHVLVKKTLIIKFSAVIIGKALLDAGGIWAGDIKQMISYREG